MRRCSKINGALRPYRRRTSMAAGSFTVEAAFVIPFCFLVLMSFTCLFQFLMRQNDIHMGLLRAVEAYGNQSEKLSSVDVLSRNHVYLQWKENEGETVCFVRDTIPIPFLGSDLCRLNRYQQMVANDYQGVSMVPAGESNEKVYVAAHASVYHRNRECTYLRTRIRAVTVQEAEGLRNHSGGKYYPCESCCDSKSQPLSATVYLAGYGERYHIHGSCPKLKRTVRQVSLSDVAGLAPCSKCS